MVIELGAECREGYVADIYEQNIERPRSGGAFFCSCVDVYHCWIYAMFDSSFFIASVLYHTSVMTVQVQRNHRRLRLSPLPFLPASSYPLHRVHGYIPGGAVC